MKPIASGNNLTLEFDNVQSTLSKVAVELQKYIGKTLYDKICDGTAATGASAVTLNADATDYLRRTMIHFAMYQHLIYIIANIGNDGVTVKKSDDSTTIYKYQQDELKDKFISDAWFWLNELIGLLNDNLTAFLDWPTSEEKKAIDALPVSIADFEQYVGISDASFMLYARWIILEVYQECILSRIKSDAAMSDKMRRALCYEVMARACQRLAYHCLPSPIRLDLNNEMGKNHSQQADSMIRDKVADVFISKAKSYWSGVDAEIASATSSAASNISEYAYRRPAEKESQPFASI